MCGSTKTEPVIPEGFETPKGYRADRAATIKLPEDAGHDHHLIAITSEAMERNGDGSEATVFVQYCPATDGIDLLGMVPAGEDVDETFDAVLKELDENVAAFEASRAQDPVGPSSPVVFN